MATEPQVDELAVRTWFLRCPLQEAITTHAIVSGIIQGRQQETTKRAPRRDKGTKRKLAEQPSLLDTK